MGQAVGEIASISAESIHTNAVDQCVVLIVANDDTAHAVAFGASALTKDALPAPYIERFHGFQHKGVAPRSGITRHHFIAFVLHVVAFQIVIQLGLDFCLTQFLGSRIFAFG